MNIFRRLASIKLTVLCLALLSVLVFWGTIAQVDQGLYLAQERFFHSWFVPLGDTSIPIFPGGALVLTILTINLFLSLLIHFMIGWRMVGVWLIHLGVLLMLVGGFFTQLTGWEGFLRLAEGEGSNVASSYRNWELSIWQEDAVFRKVTAIDIKNAPIQRPLSHTNLPFDIELIAYYPHAAGLMGTTPVATLSASQITQLESRPSPNDPQDAFPGVEAVLYLPNGAVTALFFGGERTPLRFEVQNQTWFAQLRRSRMALPVYISLTDFKHEYHPNSDVAKNYASLIEVTDQHQKTRDAIVEMNKPFRAGGWTFYQASFAKLDEGEESVFAVTLNYGRMLPYLGTGLTSLGLALHFILGLFQGRKKS